MTTQPSTLTGNKPQIAIPEEDLDRLSRLAEAAMTKMPEVAQYLELEIERAKIIPRRESSAHIVKMGARAEYRDEKTGAVHGVTLVYPNEADIERGRVSVLTPVGAALLGLSEGQSIEWTTPTSELRRLTVLAVGPGADCRSEPG
jgi:regulator of nucleoside diphosphate kinase